MHALLISTYELGRQPFGLASPAAWLRREGWHVTCVDIAKQPLRREAIQHADLVGFHLPMHTATRLAGPVIGKIKEINPSARVCAYGLYAPLNGDWLRSLGVDAVFGGEFEEDLTRYATRSEIPMSGREVRRARVLAREGRGQRVLPGPGDPARRARPEAARAVTDARLGHDPGRLLERDRHRARRRRERGREAARARGRKGGRPSVMTPEKAAVAKAMYESKAHTLAAIAQTVGVSRATLYRSLRAP